MDNYISVVFSNDQKAFDGLHALWRLDGTGDVTVHGAAVLHRDNFGDVQVATKQTDPGVRTAIGVAAGAAAGVGAAAGGFVGLTADAVKSGEHEEAAYESGFVLQNGQSAVVAEVSEDWTTPVDTAMTALGGMVFRRPKSSVRDDSFDPDYLYPYDYDPYFL
jgi:uncharacterized membrane protein